MHLMMVEDNIFLENVLLSETFNNLAINSFDM